eukprot:8387911-Heterocapsa_arctica.AAC.1
MPASPRHSLTVNASVLAVAMLALVPTPVDTWIGASTIVTIERVAGLQGPVVHLIPLACLARSLRSILRAQTGLEPPASARMCARDGAAIAAAMA